MRPWAVPRELPVVAVAVWVMTIAVLLRPGPFLFSGQVKGTDFAHFYTLGSQVRTGRLTADWDRQQRDQAAAVPASRSAVYPPVYPPQVAVLFGPFSRLSYGAALACWMSISALFFFGTTAWLRPRVAPQWPVSWTLVLASVFPPFWMTLIHGQLSAIALAGFGAFVLAFAGERKLLAGIAIGLLAYKPTLLLPALACLACAGEWKVVAGAAVSAAIEFGVGAWLAGPGSLSIYVEILRTLAARADVMAAKPQEMHSLRGFWLLLLPARAALVAYALSAGAVIAVAVATWRRLPDALAKACLLPLAVVLTSPHLYHYDLLVLVPTLLWCAVNRADGVWARRGLMLAFWSPLAGPLTAVVRVQPSVLLLVILLFDFARLARSGTRRPGAAAADVPNIVAGA